MCSRSRALQSVVILLAFLTLTNSPVAQSPGVQIAPAEDATVDQQSPAANFGLSPDLDFGKNLQVIGGTTTVWFQRGYARFDLTPWLGQPAPLRSIFWWYQDQARTTPAGCQPVSLHRVTAAWSETAVTWNLQPTYDPGVVALESVGGWDCSGWHPFAVDVLVGAWLAGTLPNHGFVIRDPTETTAGAARPGKGHSRESPVTAQRPYLELRWDRRYGAGCGTPAAPTLDVAAGDPVQGGSVTLGAGGLSASAFHVLLLGLSRTSWGGQPLPWALAGLGFPGCHVLASGELALPLTAGAAGTASLQVNVPINPWLSGQDLYAQAFSIAGAALGTTNGLQLRLH